MTDATTPLPARRRRRGLLLPLILIGLGTIFFAANLGYLPPVSARALFSLWPVLLIVFGIEAILGRREPYLALAIEILVIVASVGLAVTQPRGLFVQPTAASSSAAIARDGARSLSLRVEGAAGTYTLAGGAAALVDVGSDGGEITATDDRRGDAANVRVRPAGFGGDVVLFGHTPPVNVDVRVASDVPTMLRIQGGAGDFTLDLREIQVREARVETGASKVDLTLPKPSGDVAIRVQAGAASIAFVVPADVEARVTTTGGLVSTNTDNPRFGGASGPLPRSGTAVETAGYAAAKDRVSVTVEAGASSVTIR